MAVVNRPGGVRRLYLISDDNFSRYQRTLLMAFDWTPPKPAPKDASKAASGAVPQKATP